MEVQQVGTKALLIHFQLHVLSCLADSQDFCFSTPCPPFHVLPPADPEGCTLEKGPLIMRCPEVKSEPIMGLTPRPWSIGSLVLEQVAVCLKRSMAWYWSLL